MNNEMFYKGVLAELKKEAYVTLPPPQTKRPWYKNPAVWGGIGLAGLGGYGAYKMLGNKPAPTPAPVDNHVPLAEGTREIMNAAYGDNLLDHPASLNQPAQPSMLRSVLGGVGQYGLNLVKSPGFDTMAGLGAAGSLLNKPVLGRLGGVVGGFDGQMLYNGVTNPDNSSLVNRGLELGTGLGMAGINAAGTRNVAAGLLKFAPQTADPVAEFAAKRMALQGAKSLVGMPFRAGMRFVPGVGWAYTAGTLGQMGIEHASNAAEDYVNSPLDLALADRLKTISQGLKSQDSHVLNNAAIDARNLFATDRGNAWSNKATNPGVWATMGAGGVPNRAPLINELNKVKSQFQQTMADKHLQLPPVDPKFNNPVYPEPNYYYN